MTDPVTEERPLKEDLRALLAAPRELWIVLVAKVVESIGLYSLMFTVVLWLSQDLGMSDVRAGWWTTAFSMVITVATFFAGFLSDAVGFRRALVAAFGISAVARAGMAFAPGRAVALASLMLFAVGAAGGIPVMNAAIRRYTNTRNRSFGFAVYYLTFNVGSAVAGFIIDWARAMFRAPGGDGQITRAVRLPLLGEVEMSAWRMIYVVGLGCAVVAFLATLLLREGIDAEAEDAPAPHTASAPPRPASKGPIAIAVEVMREKAFLRFMLFIGLLSLVRMIFTHHQFTFPKYVLREMGESFPLGKLNTIDPVLITFLVPVATALTRRRSAFACIVFGAFISAASVFVLCLPASWATLVGFMVLLAVGEAIWSPRFYEYTAVIAPRGREASYLGLTSIPIFLAKLATAPMSGYLLAAYCPEQGARRSWILWSVIGLTTLAGPVLMLALRGVIEGRKDAQGPAATKVAPAATG